MYRASKKLLMASVKKEVMDVECQMVNLYSTNLTAIGTQSALIAGLAFTALNNVYQQDEISSDWLSYVYNSTYTACLIASLIVMTHTIIASMYGPKRALIGIHFLIQNYVNHLNDSLTFSKEDQKVPFLKLVSICTENKLTY